MSRAAARAIACGAAGGRNAMRRGWSFFRRLAAAVVLGAAAGLCILVSAQRPAPAPPALDAFPAVTPADRLLILAPHEDDEALAAGGLIQRARSVGAKVHVAYLTYGDHNQLAFIVYRKRPWLTPRINRNMGEVRRREAVQAMASLGVDSSGLTFLGYPDNGTLAIWRYHWGDAPPLRSVLTNTVSVPYRDAAAFGKEYKGENIAADVAAVLHAFRPTRVFVSHPADGNPDHRAFYLYLRLALRDLEGRIRRRRSIRTRCTWGSGRGRTAIARTSGSPSRGASRRRRGERCNSCSRRRRCGGSTPLYAPTGARCRAAADG